MQRSWIGATAAVVIALPAMADPNTVAATTAASVPAVRPQARGASAAIEHRVDLNSASSTDLMTLPGIGTAEATRIIANRPYLTKSELVTKNVLLVGPFVSVRHLVVAIPKTVPKAKS
ncbi:MAG TPA: helix-hairpin-helix domain-containing protein [Caldimonas sp.]|nr:helix-hairpin-helix domain-containing protein [Caldimonas sp.]